MFCDELWVFKNAKYNSCYYDNDSSIFVLFSGLVIVFSFKNIYGICLGIIV